MLFLLNRTLFVSFGMSVAFALLVGSAFGSVADYNSFVQSHSDTIICYDFEGTTNTERQQNKANTASASLNDLIEITLKDGSGTGNIEYIQGFDGTSSALLPYHESSNYNIGKVLSTNNALPLTSTVSYEAIIRPTSIRDDQNFYVVASWGDTNCRAYFTIFDDDGLRAAFGDSFSNSAYCVSSGGDSSSLVGNWYYLAVSASYDSIANTTTMTTYGANLTAGDLSLSSSSKTVGGSFLSGNPFGIGALGGLNSANCQDPASVDIDQVVFYDGVKNEAFFQANLDRIAVQVPEPSTIALLIAGGLALCLVRRRGR